MSDSDGFWGFVKDVTAIAGDILFALLLDPEERQRAGGAISRVYRLGDEEEISFSQGSQEGSVFLNNTTQALTCTCTFAVNGPQGPQTDYIVVPPQSSVEVTSYFAEYLDGGTVGLNAFPAPPDAGLGGNTGLIALTAGFAGLSIGAMFMLSRANLQLTMQATQLAVQNNSAYTYNMTTRFRLTDAEFTVSGTITPNAQQTFPYPDQSALQRNQNTVAQLTTQINSPSQNVARRRAGHLGDTAPFGPYYLQARDAMAMTLTAVGTSLQLGQKGAGNGAQEWYFTPIFNVTGTAYAGFSISPAAAPSYCVQFNGKGQPLTLVPYDPNNRNQVWVPTLNQGSGAFMFETWASVGNGDMCMDMKGSGVSPGTTVQGYSKNGSDSQLWLLATS